MTRGFLHKIPPIFFQIDNTVVADFHAFFAQAADLLVFAAEHKSVGYLPLPIDNAVAFDGFGVGVLVERVPHHTRQARIARQKCNIAVSGNATFRNLAHDCINFFKSIHILTACIVV